MEKENYYKNESLDDKKITKDDLKVRIDMLSTVLKVRAEEYLDKYKKIEEIEKQIEALETINNLPHELKEIAINYMAISNKEAIEILDQMQALEQIRNLQPQYNSIAQQYLSRDYEPKEALKKTLKKMESGDISKIQQIRNKLGNFFNKDKK